MIGSLLIPCKALLGNSDQDKSSNFTEQYSTAAIGEYTFKVCVKPFTHHRVEGYPRQDGEMYEQERYQQE